MSSGCGDVLNLEDLKTARKHQVFEAEVITGKAGGVASGADIDYATNQATGQTQKTLPAVLRDAGFDQAPFTFTTGGTLATTDRDKAVFDPVSKAWYTWVGALPKVVPAESTPVGDSDWRPWTDPTLRADLAAHNGLSLVGGAGYLTIEQFGAVRGDSSRSYAPEIQAALNASAQTGKTIRDSGTYYIKGTDLLTIPGASYPHALSIESDNLVFDFSGRDDWARTTVVDVNGVTGALFGGGGTAGAEVALPSAVIGSDTITATGLAVGDLLLIYSDDVREGDAIPQKIGEQNFVKAVSGSTVTLVTKLADTYATNPRFRKITPVRGVSIKGLKIRGKGRHPTLYGDIGFVALFCLDIDVDIDVDDVDQVGVDLIGCKRWRMTGTGTMPPKGASNATQYLYRYSSGSCDGTVDINGTQGRCAAIGGSTPNIPGVNRNIRIKGEASGVSLTGFSMHQSDSNIDYEVTAESCVNGIRLKTKGVNVKYLSARECDLGVLLYRAAQDCSLDTVIGNRCNTVVSISNEAAVLGSDFLDGIVINSISAYDSIFGISLGGFSTAVPISTYVYNFFSSRSVLSGNSAAILASGVSTLRVGSALVVASNNFDVRSSLGAKIYIDVLEVRDHTAAARILSADGAGSEVIVGKLILSGTTSANVAQETNGGKVTVFQTIDLR